MPEQIHTRTGQDARTAILAAAVSLFQRVGIERTTLTAIATELHVTKAAVYHHFNSKDDIIGAALTPLVAAVEKLLADAVAGSVPPDRLANEVIDIALEHRELVLLCQPGALAGVGAGVTATLKDLSERLLDTLAAATDPPSPVRARVLIGGLGAVLTAGEGHDVSPAEAAELRKCASALLIQR